MDGPQGSSGAPAPFLTKTYELVDDRFTNSIVSWSQSGHSFVVWNPPDFARDLLPKYFKHNNFSSFVRQLNTYGFRKIDPDQWEFANEEFVRGQRHLLKSIHRRKPIHSHSTHSQGSGPLTDTEKHELEEEIEKLKHDKSLLQLQLQRREQEWQEFEFQRHSLGGRLQSMERRQREMMAFLAQLQRRPRFASSLMQQSEIHNKKRRLLEPRYFDECDMEENSISTWQKEKQDAVSFVALYLELLEKLELSLNFWENFLLGVGQVLGEDMCGIGVLTHPSPVILTEMHALSEDPDVNFRPPSPELRSTSPCSRDIHSSPELAESTGHVDSPAISSFYANEDDVQPKSVGIDVNSRPVNSSEVVEALKEQEVDTTPPAVPTGVNDIFWEQFLTETPGSSDVREVQSDSSRDADGRQSESWPDGYRKFGWNMRNIDNLTAQLNHLTPAEKT